MDLIDWLQKESGFPKVYWKSRERSEELAACGSTHALTEPPDFKNCSLEQPFFGGVRFPLDHRADPIWKDFPSSYFFHPKFLRRQAVAALKKNSLLLHKEPSSRIDLPTRFAWHHQLSHCLHHMQNREINKIVCARRTTFIFEQPLDPFSMLKIFRENAQNTTVFAFQPSASCTFIGSTPETFYRRVGKIIYTHALAGTRPRGETPEMDLSLKNELLSSLKDRYEVCAVKDFIHTKLLDMCEWVECEQTPTVLQNAHLQHLVYHFSGKLKDHISDREIFRVLHPTPAVGGDPQEKALRLLGLYEPFDRGWYASPIGWVQPDYAEIVVGIRSALICENQLHLFSGAGIVANSCPDREWTELEQKIEPFTGLWKTVGV